MCCSLSKSGLPEKISISIERTRLQFRCGVSGGQWIDRESSRPLAKVTTTSLEALQLYSQANDAREQGDDAQLESLLQGALQLDSDFAMAHLRLGQHYAAVVSKTENALAEVERAYQLRQNVTDREQRKIEAEYYRMHERYEDEAQSLNVLVSLYPDDEEGHQALADAHYDLNQLDKAVLESREVLRLNPTSAPAYRNLALYLARANRPNEALKVYQEAQFRNVDSPQMHWGVGLAYLDQGNVANAREEFQRIGQRTATDKELQALCLTLADLYEGKLKAAHDELSRRVQAAGAQGGLQLARRYLIARIDLFNGDTHGALLQADAILRMSSAGLQTSDLVNAGTVYARAGRTDKAREVLRRLDRLQKSAPSSWNRSSYHDLEGEIGLADGKPDDAGRAFGNAAQEYPHVLAHAGLARVYQEQRRWDDAAREWEQVLVRRGEILQNGFHRTSECAVALARVRAFE
jgi:tetratricopeptide (TPR) repeat protein